MSLHGPEYDLTLPDHELAELLAIQRNIYCLTMTLISKLALVCHILQLREAVRLSPRSSGVKLPH